MKQPKTPVFIVLITILAVLTGDSIRVPVQAYNENHNIKSITTASTEEFMLFLPFLAHSFNSWPMAGANPQRTSWVPEGVDPTTSSEFGVEWYRPIEAYIGQHVQLVAANEKIFVSTARGLYALNAASGDLVWRYDTELPLGHSPTVHGNLVYVGGFDKRVYAFDVNTGTLIWTFTGATGGFSTNPLVVDGKVLLGSRDGYFYALNKDNGSLIWQYPSSGHEPLGPILYSAAYKDGMVFFASNDNFAYALDLNNGSLIWRSEKMPGDGFQAWWPVVFENYVIFSGALPYAEQAYPGTFSVREVVDPDDPYYNFINDPDFGLDFTNGIQKNDIFYYGGGDPDGTIIGQEFIAGSYNDTTGIAWSWENGKTVIDASRVTEYLEDDGQALVNRPTNKPWRRTVVVLSIDNGVEITMDSDMDGFPEYAPFLYTGTKSGNRHPPIVIPTINSTGQLNDVLYTQNMYQKSGIPRARLFAWQPETQYLQPVGSTFAIDEPFVNSSGGQILYTNLCCDRLGLAQNLISGDSSHLWGHAGFTLESIKYDWFNIQPWMISHSPGYDEMWWGASMYDYYPRVYGNYGTLNGIYHNHGLQNPIIPYNGRLYVHRSNAIIALGPNPVIFRHPTKFETPEQYEDNIQLEHPDVYRTLLEIEPPDQDLPPNSTLADVQSSLDNQISKMLQTGHLRPGYYNSSRGVSVFSNYYENPGDTLLVLLQAYPYVSNHLKTDLESYIKQHYYRYFDDVLYSRTGFWIDNPNEYDLANIDGFGQLQPREWMPLPPEIMEHIKTYKIDYWPACCVVWEYPQYNFYAIWLYASTFYSDDPTKLSEIYELSKNRIDTTAPDVNTLLEQPWIHNGYIAGYQGFLKLQELAGMAQQDAVLRNDIITELNFLLALRSNAFQKDTPWVSQIGDPAHNPDTSKRTFNLARNFLYLTPELADYLRQNALAKVQAAIDEYEYVAQYWFSARYEASFEEFASQHLYTNHAIFMAKAYIQSASTQQLLKYLYLFL